MWRSSTLRGSSELMSCSEHDDTGGQGARGVHGKGVRGGVLWFALRELHARARRPVTSLRPTPI